MPDLTLSDLAKALETYANYNAIDVFADDLRELAELRKTGQPPGTMRPLDATGETFAVALDHQNYVLRVDGQSGVANLSKPPRGAPPPDPPPVLAGAALGAAAGAAIGVAASKKGEGWLPGLVVGLLAGAAIGQATTPAPQFQPRRVFTLAFDPGTQSWNVYDGGLVGWMKQELRPSGA